MQLIHLIRIFGCDKAKIIIKKSYHFNNRDGNNIDIMNQLDQVPVDINNYCISNDSQNYYGELKIHKDSDTLFKNTKFIEESDIINAVLKENNIMFFGAYKRLIEYLINKEPIVKVENPKDKISQNISLLTNKLTQLNLMITTEPVKSSFDHYVTDHNTFQKLLIMIYKLNQLQIQPNMKHQEYYQMRRIQNGDTTLAIFIILFLVTGQKSKDKTVIETIKYINTFNKVSNK